MVQRPLMFTVDELKRLPAVSRIHFLECSGNSGGEWRGGSTESHVQRIHGVTSCSEWTGVPAATLLRECAAHPQATWALAEGADACKLARSIPMKKLLADALIVYAQNGEPLRPEQGYPMRLFLPGWEGNANVKWLRRLKVMDQPAMTREETSKYTDLMPDGTARQFTFDMDAKSVITRPSGGMSLDGAGVYELTGIAWSGRGTIARVDVTTDAASHGPERICRSRCCREHTRGSAGRGSGTARKRSSPLARPTIPDTSSRRSLRSSARAGR